MKTIINYQIISKPFPKVSYNGQDIKENLNQYNICITIPLQSARNKPSTGLLIDFMQMLFAAIILSSNLIKIHPRALHKLIMLISDSMYTRDGAESAKVEAFVVKHITVTNILHYLVNLYGTSISL